MSGSLRDGGRPWGPGVGSAACPANRAQQSIAANRVALIGDDLLQHAGGGSRYLDRHLVGFQLDDRLVDGDRIAYFLVPAADRGLGNGFTQSGYANFGSHFKIPSVRSRLSTQCVFEQGGELL